MCLDVCFFISDCFDYLCFCFYLLNVEIGQEKRDTVDKMEFDMKLKPAG